ncbi:MAG: hypothetical protein A2W22_01480 [Candidatus Levybacteria bacterium RBG_16_35_11]|nr:MAG: hypothetical protein A2W22_01480 [Candidatus Levybacteria bacterium RBG_16_35_11]
MAKKKNTGSINLLKGIQGSKLAALVVVLVILFAIPLTVVMNRQQQQIQQEASTEATALCKLNGGTCMATKSCKTGYTWTGYLGKSYKYCNSYNSPGIYCCIPKPSCSSVGGVCKINTSSYYCSITINSGRCSAGYVCCQSGSYIHR